MADVSFTQEALDQVLAQLRTVRDSRIPNLLRDTRRGAALDSYSKALQAKLRGPKPRAVPAVMTTETVRDVY